MDKTVFNKNVEMLQARFSTQLIPLREAAAYCGPDYRTLAARKDFPIVRLGNREVVPLAALAEWLTVSGYK